MYEKGKGVKSNLPQALKWLRKAAQQGYTPAQHNLGVFLTKGIATRPNTAEAIKWLRAAAGKGDVRSQFQLGEIYESGNGIEQDYSTAYAWYSLSMQGGLQSAAGAIHRLQQIMTPSEIQHAIYSMRSTKTHSINNQ
jgi:hypothetical protein